MRTMWTFVGALLSTFAILLLDSIWLLLVTPEFSQDGRGFWLGIYLISYMRLVGGNGILLFLTTAFVLSKARSGVVAGRLPLSFALASLGSFVIYVAILTAIWPAAGYFRDSSLGVELFLTLFASAVDGAFVGWIAKNWFSERLEQ